MLRGSLVGSGQFPNWKTRAVCRCWTARQPVFQGWPSGRLIGCPRRAVGVLLYLGLRGPRCFTWGRQSRYCARPFGRRPLSPKAVCLILSALIAKASPSGRLQGAGRLGAVT